mmetsp:Transcript_21635/g.47249  ORF Transcript_21635/g.47249 Transcript_21635/m.47249 type:complete len:214 (+) Transcript_21635:2041-2682(+)
MAVALPLLLVVAVGSGIGTEAFAAFVDDDDSAVSFAALFAAASPFCGRLVAVEVAVVFGFWAREAVPPFSSFSASLSLLLLFVESSLPPPLVFVFVLAILGESAAIFIAATTDPSCAVAAADGPAAATAVGIFVVVVAGVSVVPVEEVLAALVVAVCCFVLEDDDVSSLVAVDAWEATEFVVFFIDFVFVTGGVGVRAVPVVGDCFFSNIPCC